MAACTLEAACLVATRTRISPRCRPPQARKELRALAETARWAARAADVEAVASSLPLEALQALHVLMAKEAAEAAVAAAEAAAAADAVKPADRAKEAAGAEGAAAAEEEAAEASAADVALSEALSRVMAQ